MATSSGLVEESDVFDELGDSSRILEVTWRKANESCTKDGLRDGMSEGQEKALQLGFNSGYKDGFQLARNLSVWRGFIQGLNTFLRKSNFDGTEHLTELSERLAKLEADLIDKLILEKSTKETSQSKQNEEIVDLSAISSPSSEKLSCGSEGIPQSLKEQIETCIQELRSEITLFLQKMQLSDLLNTVDDIT